MVPELGMRGVRALAGVVGVTLLRKTVVTWPHYHLPYVSAAIWAL